MKIAFCITGLLKYVGGAEKSVSELANELSNRGYNLVIINRESISKESDKLFYSLNEKVTLNTFYVNKLFEGMHDPTSRTLIENRFFFLGYNPIDITIRVLIFSLIINIGAFSKWKNKLFGTKLNASDEEEDEEKAENQMKTWLSDNNKEIALWRNQLVQHKPDVVISFMNHVYILLDRALEGLNIPHIAANRNDPYHKIPYGNPFFKKRIYEAIDNARFNLIQVEAFRTYFLPEHHDKTIVIPSPIFIDESTNPDFDRKKKVILSVGSFREQKNHQLLIKSFFKICHKYPDWTVEIYGEDLGLKDEMDALIKLLGLEKRIILHPPETNIQKQYTEAAIFAMPSLYEGFSRALGEAMAHGLPSVVIENCISNSELLKNGNCGLISKNNPDDFAEKLEVLLLNRDKRIEMGKNGRNYARQFAPEKVFDMWEHLIIQIQEPRTKTHEKASGSSAFNPHKQN